MTQSAWQVAATAAAITGGALVYPWMRARRPPVHAVASGVAVGGTGIAAFFWATAPMGPGGLVNRLISILAVVYVAFPAAIVVVTLEIVRRRRDN